MDSRATSFGYRIGQLHRLVRLRAAPSLQPLGVGVGQVPFVAELFHEEGVTQDELSGRLHIDKAATARALARLEEAGFVERHVNPDNRRQKRVYLTEKARRLEREFFRSLRGVTERLSQGFSPEERELALTLLDRMIENASRP